MRAKKILGVISCLVLISFSVFLTLMDSTHGKLPSNSLSSITIIQPEDGKLYVWSRSVAPLSFNRTVIVGPIVIQAEVTGINGFEVNFFIDGEPRFHDNSWPFEYSWVNPCFGIYLITAELVDYDLTDNIKVFKIL